MRGFRLSDRLLVVGQTGMGKTTFVRWLVEEMQPVRVIAFDPKDELDFPGVPKLRGPGELAQGMRGPLVHYVPGSFDRDALEHAAQIIHATPGPLLVWIDETSEVSTPSWCPEGLRLTVTQGRSKRKMVIAVTQRAAEIHPVFRSQAEHIVMFVPAPIELDLKTLAGTIGREASELRGALDYLQAHQGDYSHLWFVRPTGELRPCAPLAVTGEQLRSTGGQVAAPGGQGLPGEGPWPPATTPDAGPAESPACEESDSASERSSRSA